MGLLDWIRSDRSRGIFKADGRTSQALERVLDLANPRLRFARRYRARLMPAVATAMEYARALVAGIPPAREATASVWQSDGYLRACFATANEIALAFSRSPELRAWFESNPGAREACAVLSMGLVETRILGIAVDGGVLRRDVPQTTLNFHDYRVRMCGRSEEDLRAEIERRIVDQLALTALSTATDARSRRDVLQQENALLRMRLRLLQARGDGLTAFTGKGPTDPADLARVHADLAMNEANLKSIATGAEALDYQLERLREVLEHPQEHFFITERHVRVDRMNVVVDDSATPGETLKLQNARVPLPEGAPEFRTFMLVRFARAALLPRGALLNDAAHMLR